MGFEEGLKDLCGGDGVEAFGGIFPRKVGGGELFPGAEAAQSLILKVDGDTKASGEAGGKAADELGLGTLGVVHIQRQPKDDGVNALGGDDIGDLLKQVFLAGDYGERGCNCLIAVADCQPGAFGTIVYSKVSHFYSNWPVFKKWHSKSLFESNISQCVIPEKARIHSPP